MDRPRPALALPFAALGLTGGWLTAHLTLGNLSSEQPLAWLLCLFTPGVCALLGEILRHRTRGTWIVRTFVSSVLAGMINGLLVGTCVGGGAGMIVGLLAGFFFGLPFLPAIFFVVAAGRRVGRASVGSLVDGADRRGVWSWTLLCIGLASLIGAAGHHRGAGPPLLSVASLTLLLVLVALAIADLRKVGRIAKLAATLQRRERTPASLVAIGAQQIDLGLGDSLYDERVASPAPYRELDKVVRVVRGDPAVSCAALRQALVRDLTACALTGVAVLIQIL